MVLIYSSFLTVLIPCNLIGRYFSTLVRDVPFAGLQVCRPSLLWTIVVYTLVEHYSRVIKPATFVLYGPMNTIKMCHPTENVTMFCPIPQIMLYEAMRASVVYGREQWWQSKASQPVGLEKHQFSSLDELFMGGTAGGESWYMYPVSNSWGMWCTHVLCCIQEWISHIFWGFHFQVHCCFILETKELL